MFNKAQFFIGIAVSAFLGFGVGYSKSREICLEALLKAMPAKETTAKKKQIDQ